MSGIFKLVDKDGYRSNVAMVISNGRGQVFWAKRVGQRAWQFPQGGIDQGETAEQALYRELYEEVGLEAGDVKIIQQTKRWLRYNIPEKMQRKHSKPRCIGQKQRWFFLQLVGESKKISFDNVKIDNKSDQNLEKFINNFNSADTKLINKVIFKNFINNFFNAYAG